MEAKILHLPVILKANYAPLLPYLAEEGLRELCINKPCEVWLEFAGGRWERREDEKLNIVSLELLASSLATMTGQSYSKRQKPTLACEMPALKHRIQITSGQMVDSGFALSMRIRTEAHFELKDFGINFGEKTHSNKDKINVLAGEMKQAPSPEAIYNIIARAVELKANILVAGGTSTGKTQFLNSLLSMIPDTERLITIEDVKELEIHQPNHVRLIKSKTNADSAGIEYKDLINATTRMRPDRIICGELDTENTLTFLRALNTGHEGSMGTVHANPDMALSAIARNVSYSGLSGSEAKKEARDVLDVIIQLNRTNQDRRVIESVNFFH